MYYLSGGGIALIFCRGHWNILYSFARYPYATSEASPGPLGGQH